MLELKLFLKRLPVSFKTIKTHFKLCEIGIVGPNPHFILKLKFFFAVIAEVFGGHRKLMIWANKLLVKKIINIKTCHSLANFSRNS